MSIRRVFFEPWSLGDVLLAASVLREKPEFSALGCHARWHALLKAALPELNDRQLLTVDLPYTTRMRSGRLDLATSSADALPEYCRDIKEVLSIRTDPRDFVAARKIFPNAEIRMSGWIAFVAHYNALVDFPFASGWLRVRNRYRAWAEAAGVPFDQLEAAYRSRQARAPRNGRIAIHVGAQWRSKQYPHVAEMTEILRRKGYTVVVLAGPSDALPERLPRSTVVRVTDASLVDEFRIAEQVVTNDSGPMHLAALMGCRTFAIVGISNIEEWLPPATRYIASDAMPRGYRPHQLYMSDNVVPGWPAAADVVERFVSHC